MKNKVLYYIGNFLILIGAICLFLPLVFWGLNPCLTQIQVLDQCLPFIISNPILMVVGQFLRE